MAFHALTHAQACGHRQKTSHAILHALTHTQPQGMHENAPPTRRDSPLQEFSVYSTYPEYIEGGGRMELFDASYRT